MSKFTKAQKKLIQETVEAFKNAGIDDFLIIVSSDNKIYENGYTLNKDELILGLSNIVAEYSSENGNIQAAIELHANEAVKN